MVTQTKDIVGWYFTINYTEFGREGKYPCHFMNPDSNVGAANVRSSFELFKPHATIISIEHGAPVFNRLGWGDAPFWKSFK